MKLLEGNEQGTDSMMVFSVLAAGRGIGNVACGPMSEALFRMGDVGGKGLYANGPTPYSVDKNTGGDGEEGGNHGKLSLEPDPRLNPDTKWFVTSFADMPFRSLNLESQSALERTSVIIQLVKLSDEPLKFDEYPELRFELAFLE
ncbi:unnamed protein product [Alternaria alternata]